MIIEKLPELFFLEPDESRERILSFWLIQHEHKVTACILCKLVRIERYSMCLALDLYHIFILLHFVLAGPLLADFYILLE